MVDSSSKPLELAALEAAIAACEGSQSEFARRIDKTQGHISQWLRRGKCPSDQVLRIEAATGVSRHRLRPDVFGYEPIPPAAAVQEAQGPLTRTAAPSDLSPEGRGEGAVTGGTLA